MKLLSVLFVGRLRSLVKSKPSRKRLILALATRARRRWTWITKAPARFDRSVSSLVRKAFGFASDRLGTITLIVFAVTVILTLLLWEWLQTDPPNLESGSTTVRNLSLVFAAIVALPLAIWRSRVAQLQAETAMRELSNQLYQKGADMLQSTNLAVRLDGIYTLERLAMDELSRYRIQVVSRFSNFVRRPISSRPNEASDQEESDESQRENDLAPEDIQAAVSAIRLLCQRDLETETVEGVRLNLRGASIPNTSLFSTDLTGADLTGADLSDTDLSHAKLSHATMTATQMARAYLTNSDMSHARLIEATLVGADISQSNLSHAILNHAKLTGVDLSDAKMLGVDLTGADLRDASLTGVNLIRANMRGSRLTGSFLFSAKLWHANLCDAQISGASFTDASLLRASLVRADLSNVSFYCSKLHYADLSGANLRDADLSRADLSGAVFSQTEGSLPATGLTQAQIDEAQANDHSPPNLDGVVDSLTDRPLVWRGRPIDQEG